MTNSEPLTETRTFWVIATPMFIVGTALMVVLLTAN